MSWFKKLKNKVFDPDICPKCDVRMETIIKYREWIAGDCDNAHVRTSPYYQYTCLKCGFRSPDW